MTQLTEMVARLTQLRLDHTEYTCLKALVLFKPEVVGLKQGLQVEVLQDQTHLMLQVHLAQIPNTKYLAQIPNTSPRSKISMETVSSFCIPLFLFWILFLLFLINFVTWSQFQILEYCLAKGSYPDKMMRKSVDWNVSGSSF